MTLLRSAALAALLFGSACAHRHHATVGNLGAQSQSQPLIVRTDPGLVDLMIEPTSPLVLAGATDELGLHIRITGKSLPTARRPPLDLAVVLDTSGSMDGAAIEAVRASAGALVDKLRDGDRLSLITFDSRTEMIFKTAVIDAETRHTAHAAIDKIVARGTTDLESGLRMAVQALQGRSHQHDLPRIVLLSDGVPNTADALPAMLAGIHNAGYSVTTLGLGTDYDTTVMTKIATDTGGSFHYLEKPAQIADVFDDELVKMTTVVARNLQLNLHAGPGVTLEPLAGFQVSGANLSTIIGDLPAGGVRDLVVPIRLVARGDGSIAELADATLTFTDVIAESGEQHRDGFASAKASKDQVAVQAAVKIDLEVARVRASASSAILEAMALARAGQVDPAKKRLALAAAMVKAAQARLKPGVLDGVSLELTNVTKEISTLVMQAAQVQIVRPPTRASSPMPMPAPAPAMAPADDERALRKSQEAAVSAVRGESHR